MNFLVRRVAITALLLLAVPALAQRRPDAPLLKAAAEGNLTVVEELLKKDADQANTKGAFGKTPLHEAVEHGHLPVAKALLDHGAAIDAVSITDGTALQLAAKSGNRRLVELLLDHGANPNAGGDHGREEPALLVAAGSGHVAVIELLLDRGAEVDVTDRMQRTALIVAAAAGQSGSVEALVARNANLDARALYSGTAFEQALRRGHQRVAEFLVAKGANVEAWLGRPPLTPDQIKDETVVRRRVSESAGIIGDFYAACSSGNKDRAAACLDLCPPLLDAPDLRCQKSALELAVAAGSAPVVELLLERGSDATKSRSLEGGILNQAIKRRSLDVVKLLLGKAANANPAVIGSQRTPLGEAVLAGDKAIAEYLLNQGADINAPSWPDLTPLDLAAEKDDLEMARLLLQRKADINANGRRKFTALHIAARRGNCELVELLLNNGADLDAKDAHGDTPLQVAANAKKKEVVTLLAEKGGQTNIATWVSLGDVERVRSALENDPTLIGKQSGQGLTLLHLGAASGQPEMVELLLSKQAKPEICDQSGQTALHLAVRKGNLQIVRILFQHKADPNARDARGETPFDATHERSMKELLSDFGGHTGRELWPGEVRRGSTKRPAAFEGKSVEVRGFKIFAGGQYRFESPDYSLLLRNVDGKLYSECSIPDGMKRSKITIDPRKDKAVTLVEVTGDKQQETSYEDLGALEDHAPQLVQRYRKLRQEHDDRKLEGEWHVEGPATSSGSIGD